MTMRTASILTASDRAADSVAANAGVMLRIRAWFAALLSVSAARPCQKSAHENMSPTFDADGLMDFTTPVGKNGTVIAFPRSKKIPLTQLADDLHRRFVALGLPDHAPVQLRIEDGDEPCLWIDSAAYVEACHNGFRVVINDVFDVRITLEARDLDSIAEFVRHYIVARLDAASLMRGLS